jgi:hypothetical protein
MSDEPVPTPSIWRMAATATMAAAQYAASGFKTVPAETQKARLDVCETCPHRKENVCQVCGCYIDKKSWLPFEDCPIGKWPV